MGVGQIRTGREYENSRMPHDLEGIREYYKERGYSEPLLEMPEDGVVASFVKPTGQSRHHVRVIVPSDSDASYKIDSHIDKHDPSQDPVGHITADILGSPKHTVKYVTKAD